MRKIFFAILLLGLGLITGCATSGGAGGGGASDSDITAAVKDAFKQDEVLSSANIEVNTEKGVVTLSGVVPNAMAYTRAISLARRVPGVKPPVQAANLTYSR
jgi:hyperosmotically inducible protein